MSYKILLKGFILTMIIIVATQGASCQMQGSAGQNSTPDVTPREAYNRLLNISIEIAYLDTMISLSD